MSIAPPPPVANVRRLPLPQVTLCAVSSVNIQATIRAMEICINKVEFARCLILTDTKIANIHKDVEIIEIKRLNSSEDYSIFILSELVNHIQTPHCMIAQWDGHVRDTSLWTPEFLDYDYTGASWPQFDDGHDVGNGGFSLRSKRLMELCKSPSFVRHHPEDLAIGRTNRRWLEQQDIRFAPRELADRFSSERAGDLRQSFGYHGLFLMPQALGNADFWKVYETLDDVGTLRHDFHAMIKAVIGKKAGLRRAWRILLDRIGLAIRS